MTRKKVLQPTAAEEQKRMLLLVHRLLKDKATTATVHYGAALSDKRFTHISVVIGGVVPANFRF